MSPNTSRTATTMWRLTSSEENFSRRSSSKPIGFRGDREPLNGGGKVYCRASPVPSGIFQPPAQVPLACGED
eukprot:9476235-Pyramimonas_sp.AAC.1